MGAEAIVVGLGVITAAFSSKSEQDGRSMVAERDQGRIRGHGRGIGSIFQQTYPYP